MKNVRMNFRLEKLSEDKLWKRKNCERVRNC